MVDKSSSGVQGAYTPPSSTKTNPLANKTADGIALNDPSIHGKLVPTAGWFVALGCGVGILTANTRFGKITFGILTLALMYQVSQWALGK